jgi:hypothetical protein
VLPPRSPPSPPGGIERYHHGRHARLDLGGSGHIRQTGEASRRRACPQDQDMPGPGPGPAAESLAGVRASGDPADYGPAAGWNAAVLHGNPARLPAALPGNAEGDDDGHHEQHCG